MCNSYNKVSSYKLYSGFEKDPRTSKFGMHVKVPFDVISGLYSMSGRILLIPIQGTGKANMSFSKTTKHKVLRIHTNDSIIPADLDMEVKFKTSVDTRDNEDYLKINKVQLDITCNQ